MVTLKANQIAAHKMVHHTIRTCILGLVVGIASLDAFAQSELEPVNGRSSCPDNFTLVGTPGSTEAFCISSRREENQTWLDAVSTCRGKTPKARLCSASEWVAACVDGAEGPNNMKGHWEWVADLYDDHGQVMGNPGCDSFYAYRLISTGGFRCCFR
jgi:hypothetical protein